MIVKTHDVFCDRCPNWADGASRTDSQGGAVAARKKARGHGWRRRDGEDLCPACVAALSSDSAVPERARDGLR